jgi:hypothetical protein
MTPGMSLIAHVMCLMTCGMKLAPAVMRPDGLRHERQRLLAPPTHPLDAPISRTACALTLPAVSFTTPVIVLDPPRMRAAS